MTGVAISGLFLSLQPASALNAWATYQAHASVDGPHIGMVSWVRWVYQQYDRSVVRDLATAAICAIALAGGVASGLWPALIARFSPIQGGPMRDHTWFILTLRAIGIVLIALGLPHAVDFIRDFCQFVFGDWANMVVQGRTIPTIFIVAFGGFSQLALGLYLAFGGKWFIRRCLKEVTWKCNLCGYDCRAVTSGRCPECGFPLPGSADAATRTAAR